MRASVALGVTGFSLIAVTYGMARFSWGLMMPAVVTEIPFSPGVSGIIAASSYMAYCLSALGASLLVARFGPRLPAVTSVVCAAAGLVMLACAFSPLMLATGLFIAGLSSGLASPSLAGAVTRTVSEKKQNLANTVINAGTGAGIIFSVPILLLMPGGWRAACITFGAAALLCLFPVLRYLPDGAQQARVEKIRWRDVFLSQPMMRLAIIAFISGMASAAWWSFGPDILRHHNGVDAKSASMLWLVSGGAGIAGVLTGIMANWLSMKQIYRLSQLAMAAPLILLAYSHSFSWWFIPAVALCGAGYVILSGVLLVWGATSGIVSPAAGVSMAFFMLAAGQVTGSVVFGQIYAQAGAALALTGFALLSLLMMFLTAEKNR